jgi:hypothetical protein
MKAFGKLPTVAYLNGMILAVPDAVVNEVDVIDPVTVSGLSNNTSFDVTVNDEFFTSDPVVPSKRTIALSVDETGPPTVPERIVLIVISSFDLVRVMLLPATKVTSSAVESDPLNLIIFLPVVQSTAEIPYVVFVEEKLIVLASVL